MNDSIQFMDLRIKSIVVIPSPKYYGKWLIITGNSRGTIRCYTFDENKPSEFQFEGEDCILHKDNNSSSPILSLTSTYSTETCYHFPNTKTMLFSPFNHIQTVSAQKQQRGGQLNINPLSKESDTIPLKNNRIIGGYSELPPHLIFSGATDGWIRIWFWDIDSHCIQLVERLAIHQSGVNSISATWLDAKFINKNLNNKKKNIEPIHIKQSSTPLNRKTLMESNNNSESNTNNNDGLLTRRLGILSGEDDQSMTLIIADFESTMSMTRAHRKRSKHQKHNLLRKSLIITNLKLGSDNNNLSKRSIPSSSVLSMTGWKFNVIKEIPINTAHIASIRSVAITPIITPNIVKCFSENEEKERENNNNLRMNEILLISTGDDQMLKCWSYKFEKQLFQSESIIKENISLLDDISLDIGLPNVLSMYYIYNSGILLSIGGQGIQIVTLPFDKYLFKKIYYNKEIRKKYKNQKNKQNKQDDN